MLSDKTLPAYARSIYANTNLATTIGDNENNNQSDFGWDFSGVEGWLKKP